ncbi:hypothetical protein BO99DRAFT_404884 [Aspergillus violaceofuscus CBS 115571]|uniref:Uncharacterized protein n=1 Tax=Aspergillus violaceofuscus (strain CBS 115571) TaxID=1450538 RepID=A0A2V5H763_ASPV1|nr:hypothetical protein BO99DRAFT_404884 [Aspergillus violaceofuscus CBS 115571]
MFHSFCFYRLQTDKGLPSSQSSSLPFPRLQLISANSVYNSVSMVEIKPQVVVAVAVAVAVALAFDVDQWNFHPLQGHKSGEQRWSDGWM